MLMFVYPDRDYEIVFLVFVKDTPDAEQRAENFLREKYMKRHSRDPSPHFDPVCIYKLNTPTDGTVEELEAI